MKKYMTAEDFVELVRSFSPEELQEPWDNSGFQIKTEDKPLKAVVVTLEVTGEVIEFAKECGAGLIVTHHPLIFSGLKSIDSSDVTGRYIMELLKCGISVYSAHTNFDKALGGNGDYLGELMGACDIEIPTYGEGFCRTGRFKEKNSKGITAGELMDRLCQCLDIKPEEIRFIGSEDTLVSKAAWCTGSGADFIKDAKIDGCDVFITGDVKYHDAMWALESGFTVIDAGHYGTEKLFPSAMERLLKEAVEKSEEKAEETPVYYGVVVAEGPFSFKK